MNQPALFKSSQILMLPKLNVSGYLLYNPENDKSESLDNEEIGSWSRWDMNFATDKLISFLSNGFAYIKNAGDSETQTEEWNYVIPTVTPVHAKWYAESPDLTILFCTKQMKENNPLLVLNSYGSLCWRGVLERKTIGEIRSESIRIFGADEVVLFLKRLEWLGFIDPIPLTVNNPQEHIIKEVSGPEIQFRLMHSRIPWYCLWELCMKCNYRCKVCYLPHFKSGGLDSIEALNVAQQIIDSGIFYVCLLGGEPLLRDDINAIVRKLRAAGVFVKIITNGHFLDSEKAHQLSESGLNQIEVSFDGISCETHDASRGEGTFEQAKMAIANAISANIPRIAVVWTIHSGNLPELIQLPAFLRSLHVRECYISVFKKTGLNGSVAPYDTLTFIEIESVKEQLSSFEQSYPDMKITLLPTCSCGHTSVVIGDQGDVRFCSFSYYSVGNVTETPLLKLWNPNAETMQDNSYWGYCEKNYKDTVAPLLESIHMK